MTQPVWITPAGSLGTIPEGVFYRVPVQAVANGQDVFFQLIAGQLPAGIQVTTNGQIEGTPRNIINVQGVPTEISEDLTSKFAIRAYTVKIVDGLITVDRIADRTFSITVAGQDVPEFITPAGNIGTFYDGSEVNIPIRFSDTDPDDTITIKLLSGEFPPGVDINARTGVISGIIKPLVGPPGTATAGYDATPYDQFPWDFSTRSASKNYQFTLTITDGKDSNIRTFEIFVYSKDSMSADTTDFTADNTFITADVVPARTPILTTPVGDLGVVRADNFYAFKFDAIDFDGDAIEYSITVGVGQGFDSTLYDEDGIGFDRGAFSLPPGLQIDPDTGWFYGYIPDQGATELTYRFAIRVLKKNQPTVISGFYFFTVTVIGNLDTRTSWITPTNLGSVLNGSISILSVEAINIGGRTLEYQLAPGTNSRLPQGLTLQPSGNITGRVSFNTFALDGGTTTFDALHSTRLELEETTFDMVFDFTVNAFSPQTEQIGYQVSAITVINGGTDYDPDNPPVITISPPPNVADAIQATVGVVTIVNGAITAIALGNPGRGYEIPPVITISSNIGDGAVAVASLRESTSINAVSIFRRFSVRVLRAFNKPYEKLYIKAMPPGNDRGLLDQLLQNQDIIPNKLVYRADDPNFGVAKSVVYDHAYGLDAATIEQYVSSLDINHYWKYLTLGKIRTAQARDADGNVIYEVVYSSVVDTLVNDLGESVGKQVRTPYSVDVNGDIINTVYPNSLVNMRDQVISEVGQLSPFLAPALPLWMTSKQSDGRVLGFTPAWVIAYVKPGQADRVVYNIRERFGDQLNVIDFKVDRYELDRSQTHIWDTVTEKWIPQPPAATTFDLFSTPSQFVSWQDISGIPVIWTGESAAPVFWNTPPSGISLSGTIFDGGSTTFITPTDTWPGDDRFDKYLVFPRINILE
jgi:hypothetical protein